MTQRHVLPWPPSKNRLHRAINRGRFASVILSKEAREYYAAVQRAVGNNAENTPSRLAVTIYLHAPTRRGYDLDGRVVGLLDALEAACVFQDDNQIDLLVVHRCEVIKGGKAVVHITEVPND